MECLGPISEDHHVEFHHTVTTVGVQHVSLAPWISMIVWLHGLWNIWFLLKGVEKKENNKNQALCDDFLNQCSWRFFPHIECMAAKELHFIWILLLIFCFCVGAVASVTRNEWESDLQVECFEGTADRLTSTASSCCDPSCTQRISPEF